MQHGLGERELALGAAEPLIGLPAGERGGQGRRVRQPDILRGEADQPAGDVAGSSPPSSIRASQ